MTPELKQLIVKEARTKHSSPYRKDNPETFAYISGAEWMAGIAEGFAEWATNNFSYSIADNLWHDGAVDGYTTSELLNEYFRFKKLI